MIVRWTDPRYKVFLDGKEIDSYHEADDEAGYVVVTKTIYHNWIRRQAASRRRSSLER